MKRYATKMLHYDAWAFSKITEAFEHQHITDEKCLAWLSHIVWTYRHWLERFQKGTSTSPIWETRSLDEIKKLYQQVYSELEHFIADQSGSTLQENISYSNSKGQKFEQPLEDLVIHVFNHATHHRGQIVSRLRDMGYQPPRTDYVVYMREKLA